MKHPEITRPPRAEKWFQRARGEFQSARIDAAHDSAQRALDLVPADEQVRMLAAQIALARLELAEALRLLRGIPGSDAAALRGRAHWYKGDLGPAADAFEVVLADPEVVDPWAKSIMKLARRGTGRKPFSVSTTEGRLVSVQMVRVPPSAAYFVVPLEIDGDSALALVSTGTAEVILDSSTRREPSWVSLRFGRRLEVRDVPTLSKDLSQLSTQLGAPIKALLGVNLLRQLNATLDLRGRQFVLRNFVPPPPPVASRVDPYYLRGGGMVVSTKFGRTEASIPAALFVDTSMGFPVALDQGGWEKLGIGLDGLTAVGGGTTAEQKMKTGTIPLLKFGAYDLPGVSAVYFTQIDRMQKELAIDVDGAVGAGLLASFRLTFADGGRVLWLEKTGNRGVPVPVRRGGPGLKGGPSVFGPSPSQPFPTTIRPGGAEGG